jgi:membrane protease YdiL (CAAX protease family)
LFRLAFAFPLWKALMLFYIKRFLSLEIAVTFLLGGLGYWGMQRSDLPLVLRVTPRVVAMGVAGSLWLTLWTFLVQYGYAVVKGKSYAQELTATLAKSYAHVGVAQVVLAGVTAACGEEIFFRGFLQQSIGLIPASLLFMLAHFGKKEIRIISLWSVFQALYLGLFFIWSKICSCP